MTCATGAGMRLLIVYSTIDGHTLEICERIAAIARATGHEVELAEVESASAEQLEACDRIVIGASIRYGKHKPEVAAFIARHRQALEARPNALFSVNVVARKPGKDVPEGNPYLQKLLSTIDWKPRRLAVFAGRIDYPSLGVLDRTMIRLIMWMTKGPTDPRAVVEFTDWARVEAFGREFAQALSAQATA